MRFLVLATAATFVFSSSCANAGLIYRFSGGVDVSTDTNTVALNETFTASFVVDSAASNTGPDVNGVVNYPNAILSASIEFSGGLTRQFASVPNLSRIGIGDNIFGGGFDFIDAEIGDTSDVGVESLYTSVLEADNTLFSRTDLLGPGASFSGSFGGMDLRYEDSGGAFQTVSFSGTAFFASVPEPGSFGLLSLFATGLLLRRRSRDGI